MSYSIKLYIVSAICFFAMALSSSARTVLEINDQSSFDVLQKSLTSLIKKGEKDIYVSFAPGTYIAKEKHLTLKDIKAADMRIRIVGNGAVIVPEGKVYGNGDQYQGDFSTDYSWMCGENDVENWSKVRYADGLIEILDAKEKHCRLKSKSVFPANTDVSNGFILIPHWYQSSVYKINKIDRQYIYFTADDLKESRYGGYNVNDDYGYGQKGIRYKLCNVETGDDCLRIINGKIHLPNGINSVREGTAHNYIGIRNCKLSSVEISGFSFWGNAFAESYSAIQINNSECKEIKVQKCNFYGMRGNVIAISSSPNVSVAFCRFMDCYCNGVKSNNESAGTVVNNNLFNSMGKRMNNTLCVECRGMDYHVFDNVFYNFGYGGVAAGFWFKAKMKSPSSGIIENNEMSCDQNYLNNIDNYGIMDGGAIYLATKNSNSIVRYNYIHGFSGMKSNRGIFCDDGAYNFEIYGNVITGIANSRCIDSRRVTSVEKTNTPESGIDKANVNIVIRDNIVDGSIRFEAHEEAGNGCVKGANYVLIDKDSKIPNNVISNITDNEDDILLEYSGMKKGRIGLSPSSYHQLKRTEVWRSVRQRVINNRVLEK